MESLKSRKLRGGYYTPKKISDFIASWAIQDKSDKILEPSCGDGEFLESSITRLINLCADKAFISQQIHSVECDPIEAEKAHNRFLTAGIKPVLNQIVVGDFFKYCRNNLADKVQFDCILGNPPFIRYQDFPEEQQLPAFALMVRAGLKPSRLTNAWIPFLVASTLLLKSGGRIGMVIPAELFQVNYAAETRRFLSDSYNTLIIITFRQLVFPDVQQEVVLLLGEKNGKTKHGIKIVEVNNIDDLAKLNIDKFKKNTTQLDHSSEKWTQYYLTSKEIDTLRGIKADSSIPLSGEFIDVDVGIVTGQNRFFVITQEEVSKYNLNNYVVRIIGRANHIKGIVATDNDWKQLAVSNNPVFLLNIPDVTFDKLPQGPKRYIEYGASQGFCSGYKCKIRKKWWVVPSVWVPDAFMLRQVHLFPKIVVNKCNATATDTLHRVKLINSMNSLALSCAFLNSLTLAYSEVTGRSYGGGVLTFEPSEAERLPLPVKNSTKLNINEIDQLLRKNKIKEVLDITDDMLLRRGLQLPEKDISVLRDIWCKLRDRRIQRRNTLAVL
jgi:adenine-specific DNA-methyltransferase